MEYSKLLERKPINRDSEYEYRKMILERVKGKILDVGCGTGRIMKMITKEGNEVLGIDLDEGNVRFCKKEGLDVRKASITKIPFRDNHFDFVICWNLLEHLERDELLKAGKELMRVAKRGGKIIIHAPNLTPKFWDMPDHTYPVSEEKVRRLFDNASEISFPRYTIPKLRGLLVSKMKSPKIYDLALGIIPLRSREITNAVIMK